MTDEQIIKALECCVNEKKLNCNDCPLDYMQSPECVRTNLHNALDLINRQKAEIERLRNIVKADLLIAKEDFKLSLSDIAKIRAEAIKEFVKKFEKKIKDVKFTLGQTWEIQNALKDTLKEMVGDDND